MDGGGAAKDRRAHSRQCRAPPSKATRDVLRAPDTAHSGSHRPQLEPPSPPSRSVRAAMPAARTARTAGTGPCNGPAGPQTRPENLHGSRERHAHDQELPSLEPPPPVLRTLPAATAFRLRAGWAACILTFGEENGCSTQSQRERGRERQRRAGGPLGCQNDSRQHACCRPPSPPRTPHASCRPPSERVRSAKIVGTS